MDNRILVVGSVNIDLVVHAPRLPLPGETIQGELFEIFNGGKGANQAVGIAKLGGGVDMIACLGADLFGDRLLSGLNEARVGTYAIERVSKPSGVALISIAQDGENSIVVVAGANGALSPRHIDTHRERVENARMVLTQLEIPLETVTHLAELAWKAGIPLMLDPSPAMPLPISLLRQIAWLTPNEREVGILAGDQELAPEMAVSKLLELGVQNIALKLGAKGVLLAGRSGAMRKIPAFPVNAVDTTGAGDCFNAAFALALTRGDSPEIAARYGAAAAAITVTRSGAQPSLPTSKEVERVLSQPLPLS